MAPCKLCNKRLLAHALKLTCSYCQQAIHLNCISSISREDSVFINNGNDTWFCPICIQETLPFNHYFDEDDFLSVITEMNSTENPGYHELINSRELIFNPFEINDSTEIPIDDIDPDFNYYNSFPNISNHTSDYHTENTFKNKTQSMDINDNNLSIIHMNIRSAPCNLQKFENYMANLQHKFTIIGLTET